MNKTNADNAVLFDAVLLIISYGIDPREVKLHDQASTLLGRFVAITKDANVRCLGLDALARLAKQVRGGYYRMYYRIHYVVLC